MGALSDYWPTLLDVTRRMSPTGGIDVVAEILQEYNDVLEDIPWVEGNLPTGHQTTIRTSNPAPTFRLLNQGVVPVKTTTGQIVDTCAILEARNHIDKDLAMLNGNTAAFRLSEDKGIVQEMSNTLADTLIYGDTSTDPEKFNGLAARYYAITTATTAANVIDGGGTGSDNTSIWLVCWSPDKVFGIYPKGSQGGLQQRDLGEQSIVDPNTTGAYMQALVSWYQWKCGICVRDWRYVVRIANIDVSSLLTASDSSDTSANLFKLMSKALDRVPPMGKAYRPVFYMNETVRSMLRVKMMDKTNLQLTLGDLKSESIARPQGVLQFMGVPCRRIDSILNTETALT